MLKKIKGMILMIFILSLALSNTCFATTNHQYVNSRVTNINYRGTKGDFKLPSIDAKYSSTYDVNFITFEEWIPVIDSSADNWFEVGYMDGALDPENDGTTEDYTGFFKAKQINGIYVEAKLSKTATVGTTYTITIVDVNAANLWEIYIGSTYLGSFSDNVTAGGYYLPMGYEIQYDTNTTPTVSATTIDDHYYYTTDTADFDNDGNTTERIWLPWTTKVVSISDGYPGLSASYSSTYNKTTFY